MTDLEVMYRRGVPLCVLQKEAEVQARNGTLEVGALEFLFSTSAVEKCPRLDQAKKKGTFTKESL